MFHKAIELEFKEATTLELTFQDGQVKSYDMSELFGKYPQLEALKDRELFLSGRLMGNYGIIWNDELDIEAESIYEEGTTVKIKQLPIQQQVANAISLARAKSGLSQKELSLRTNIDQSDISKIERGVGNPSVNTLNRLAKAMEMELKITIE